MNITILSFDSIASTNDEAIKHARLGADEGLCIVARQQTAGRGRHGRTWVSEKDAGLYFSIVLRPKLETKNLPLITLMAGVAVSDTLSEFGIKPDIKWVNDILVDERKISGILAETVETAGGIAVVVGIGINLKSNGFPPEIADSAISIRDVSRTAVAPSVLTETLIKFLSYFYNTMTGENGPAVIIEEWRKRSTYFSGKSVRVTVETRTFTGTTDGLEPNGALRIRKDDGSLSIVQAGNVEKLRSKV